MTTAKDAHYLRRIGTLQACFLAFGLMVAGFLIWTQLLARAFERFPSASPLAAPARRGSIVDRNGHNLAFDVYLYTVGASPKEMTNQERDALSAALAPVLKMSPSTIRELLESRESYVPIAKKVDYATAEVVRVIRDRGYPIKLDPTPVRFHPERALAAHVLGFVNNEGKGCYGLEAYYEALLNPASPQNQASNEPAQEPPQLVLTIDRVIQQIVEEELDRGMRKAMAPSGQAIVMDPATGEVLAMAAFPTYDPDRWMSFPAETWENSCVARLYEPGSVFKIITYASALDSGCITPNKRFYDSGVIEYGGSKFRNWDNTSHGGVSAVEALACSLNTVAVQIARDLGKETFYTYARRFGFGRATEIDLGNEAAGILRTPSDGEWTDSDLATNSFGQGISATPLQVICAAASIANGGVEMMPHLVKARVAGGKTESVLPVAVRRTVSLQTSRTLTQMLTEAVETELQHAKVPGYTIAGKTGTSQIPIASMYHPTDTIASFVGWGPAEQPAIIILVKLDRPKAAITGVAVAVPIFRAIAERVFQYLQIPPDSTQE